MNKYLLRVELHDATPDAYEELHRRMARAGFTRVIMGDDGYAFALPPAEYTGETSLTVIQVRDLVAGIAQGVVQSAAVLVTEYTSAAWFLPLAA